MSVLLAEGKMDQARNQLEPLREEPNVNWRLYNGLGVIADFSRAHQLAADYYQQALQQGGNSKIVLNNLGYSQLMAEQYDDAIKTLRDVARRYPDAVRAKSNLALAQARAGQYHQARRTWASFLTEHEAWSNAGYIAMKNGDIEQAERFLEKAIEMAPRYFPTAERHLQQVKALRQAQPGTETESGISPQPQAQP